MGRNSYFFAYAVAVSSYKVKGARNSSFFADRAKNILLDVRKQIYFRLSSNFFPRIPDIILGSFELKFVQDII